LIASSTRNSVTVSIHPPGAHRPCDVPAVATTIAFETMTSARSEGTMKVAARAVLDRGEFPIVLDVRTPGARKHNPRAIPNAILAHMDDVATQLGDLAPHTEVVLYCT
jgi:hypothetical protein